MHHMQGSGRACLTCRAAVPMAKHFPHLPGCTRMSGQAGEMSAGTDTMTYKARLAGI